MNLSSPLPPRWLPLLIAGSLAACILVALAPGFAGADASEGPISTGRFNNVAIGGHDTVAYRDVAALTAHSALKGEKSWVHEWRGATWRFGSEQSYNLFKVDPAKYQPAYGGFCSNALSLGEGLVRTDGSHWEILDDRLHLFYAARGRDRWLDGNQATYREQADRAWRELTGFDNE